jgi:hypothetical protein
MLVLFTPESAAGGRLRLPLARFTGTFIHVILYENGFRGRRCCSSRGAVQSSGTNSCCNGQQQSSQSEHPHNSQSTDCFSVVNSYRGQFRTQSTRNTFGKYTCLPQKRVNLFTFPLSSASYSCRSNMELTLIFILFDDSLCILNLD